MSYKVTLITISTILALGCILFVNADVSHITKRQQQRYWSAPDTQFGYYDSQSNTNYPGNQRRYNTFGQDYRSRGRSRFDHYIPNDFGFGYSGNSGGYNDFDRYNNQGSNGFGYSNPLDWFFNHDTKTNQGGYSGYDTYNQGTTGFPGNNYYNNKGSNNDRNDFGFGGSTNRPGSGFYDQTFNKFPVRQDSNTRPSTIGNFAGSESSTLNSQDGIFNKFPTSNGFNSQGTTPTPNTLGSQGTGFTDGNFNKFPTNNGFNSQGTTPRPSTLGSQDTGFTDINLINTRANSNNESVSTSSEGSSTTGQGSSADSQESPPFVQENTTPVNIASTLGSSSPDSSLGSSDTVFEQTATTGSSILDFGQSIAANSPDSSLGSSRPNIGQDITDSDPNSNLGSSIPDIEQATTISQYKGSQDVSITANSPNTSPLSPESTTITPGTNINTQDNTHGSTQYINSFSSPSSVDDTIPDNNEDRNFGGGSTRSINNQPINSMNSLDTGNEKGTSILSGGSNSDATLSDAVEITSTTTYATTTTTEAPTMTPHATSTIAAMMTNTTLDIVQGVPRSKNPVNENCMRCLCEASTKCDKNRGCERNGCGMFRITEIFWLDVGRPTLIGGDEDAEDAFKNCVLNEECSKRAIQLYMRKYRQDCNNDGVINCYDYAAIHKFGAFGCFADFSVSFYSKLHGCLQQVVDEDQPL